MAVLTWNEILQRDKQAQMTGATGLTPEQLGALREAELTEGAVNARNIFNQNEINRRNAVAEKQASDMLSAQKRGQNFEAAVKLGMIAKEYYPQVKNAVVGLFDTATTTGAGMALDVSSNAAPTAINLANTAGSSTATGAVDTAAGWGAEGATAANSAGLSVGGSIVYPFAVGYSAPGLIDSLHKDSMENLGHNITGGAVRHEKTAKQVGGTVTGGAAGAIVGGFSAGASATSWSGPGAIVGGIIGALGGLAAESCIIVTACTDRNSYEVEITRQYRDKFLTGTQLRGYYILAEKLVPTLENNEKIRNFTKKYLVDKLIDYGELKLGLVDKCKLSSRIVSNLFLGLIKTIGFFIPKYTRLNGEIY